MELVSVEVSDTRSIVVGGPPGEVNWAEADRATAKVRRIAFVKRISAI